MKNTFLSVLILLGWTNVGAAENLPNIVIIYADDMGFGDLAVQNSDAKIPTPNLDQLAREGLRCTDAHSSSGICTPSRYALLTGRYHWRKFHNIVNSWEPSVIDDPRLTLPEMLKTKGYHTACIGKWHLGWDWPAIRIHDAKMISVGKKKTWPADAFDWSKPIPAGPLAHGFDHYFGDDVPNFPPYTWIENDRVLEAPTVPYEPDPRPVEGAAEGRPGPMVKGWKQDAVMPTLTRRTVEWIGQQKGKKQPFFLFWSWTSPHAPIVPAADWKGHTDVGGYGDFLAQSDHHAGEVLRAIEANGFKENTIVIFTSDNGPERYAFDRFQKFDHNSSGHLRGLKRDLWEGGHRVPFVVRWPGKVTAGSVSDGLVSQIDIMATLAAVVDFELPETAAEDSHSQTELFTGGRSARESTVHNTWEGKYAIRHQKWLMIDAPSGQHSKMPDWFGKEHGFKKFTTDRLLFDLENDPGQRNNIAASNPKQLKKMQALLEQTRARGEVRNPVSQQAGDVIFFDDFNRSEADDSKEQPGNDWSTNSETRAKGDKQVDLANGAMHVTCSPRADHAVSVTHEVAFRDATIELRFKLSKGDSLGVNIADMKEKSVHAGHICMAQIKAKKLAMTDLKTGRMDRARRKRRQNGNATDEDKRVVKQKSKWFDFDVGLDQWHDLSVTIRGNTMTVAIDGQAVGDFRSEGIGHPTKSRLRLSVPKSAWVDDVKVTRHN